MPGLFDPLAIRDLTFTNRVFVSPMGHWEKIRISKLETMFEEEISKRSVACRYLFRTITSRFVSAK
jgi:2,4-dienoyl-CoA reductase-like NADH-dependent reductase (Old Yellow Enzyme family)